MRCWGPRSRPGRPARCPAATKARAAWCDGVGQIPVAQRRRRRRPPPVGPRRPRPPWRTSRGRRAPQQVAPRAFAVRPARAARVAKRSACRRHRTHRQTRGTPCTADHGSSVAVERADSLPTVTSATAVPRTRPSWPASSGTWPTATSAGYSPLYEHLARHIADDDAHPRPGHRGATAAATPPCSSSPACTTSCCVDPDGDLARALPGRWPTAPTPLEPDAWPAFRALVARPRRRARPTCCAPAQVQTNEVGRSAALVPALTVVGRAVRAAAGPDRGRLQRRAQPALRPLSASTTRRAAAVGPGRLAGAAALRGARHPAAPRPRADRPPPVRVAARHRPQPGRRHRSRRRPLAARPASGPTCRDRAERFEAAVALARAGSTRALARATPLDLVDEAVDRRPGRRPVPCLISTWVLAYLTAERARAELHRLARRARPPAPARLRHRRVRGQRAVAGTGRAPAGPRPAASSPTRLGLGLWDQGRTEHGRWPGCTPTRVARMARRGLRRLTGASAAGHPRPMPAGRDSRSLWRSQE